MNLPLIKPPEKTEAGDVIYDTLSSAAFSVGQMGPNSKKPFSLSKLLKYISGEISEDVPEKIVEFFAKEGEVTVGFEMSIDEALKPPTKGTQRYREEIVYPASYEAAQEALKGWRKRKPPSASWLAQEIRERMDDEIEASVSVLRQNYVPRILEELDNA